MKILSSGLVDFGSLFCILNISLRYYGQIILAVNSASPLISWYFLAI